MPSSDLTTNHKTIWELEHLQLTRYQIICLTTTFTKSGYHAEHLPRRGYIAYCLKICYNISVRMDGFSFFYSDQGSHQPSAFLIQMKKDFRLKYYVNVDAIKNFSSNYNSDGVFTVRWLLIWRRIQYDIWESQRESQQLCCLSTFWIIS